MPEKDNLRGKRILVVDDERDVLDTISELLSMCEVVKAENYQDARKLLENDHFDMAILDIMGVNGFDLLEIAKDRGIMTVMLTAHALSPENTIRSYKSGAASYIPKEAVGEIVLYLEDLLEAKHLGKNPWWRWLDRFGNYYERKFGLKWQEADSEFWHKFKYYV